jgi:hypothetical protein
LQILQLIPRLEFESAVRQHHAERHAQGFTSWGQFIAMLFCQLGHAKSLREICGGLAASEGKLRHWRRPGWSEKEPWAAPDEHRPWQLHRTVFEQLLAKCQMLVASPIIIAPIYYRMFQKTDMTAKEYVAVLLPSVNASALMAAVLFGIRAVIPAKLPAVLGLSILTIGGAIAYWCALYAFHRARVLHLMNTIKRMLESR